MPEDNGFRNVCRTGNGARGGPGKSLGGEKRHCHFDNLGAPFGLCESFSGHVGTSTLEVNSEIKKISSGKEWLSS